VTTNIYNFGEKKTQQQEQQKQKHKNE